MEEADNTVGFWAAVILGLILVAGGLWLVYQFYQASRPTTCAFQCAVPLPNSNAHVLLKSTRTGLPVETKVTPDVQGKAIVEITDGKCTDYEAEFENAACQSLNSQQPSASAP
jgi:hypothetical protein